MPRDLSVFTLGHEGLNCYQKALCGSDSSPFDVAGDG